MKKGNSKVLLPGLGGIVCCPTLTKGPYQNKAVLGHIIIQVTNHQTSFCLPNPIAIKSFYQASSIHLAEEWEPQSLTSKQQRTELFCYGLCYMLLQAMLSVLQSQISMKDPRTQTSVKPESLETLQFTWNFAIYILKKMKLDQILPLFNKDLLWGASAELWNLSNTMLCRESKWEFGSMLWTRRNLICYLMSFTTEFLQPTVHEIVQLW